MAVVFYNAVCAVPMGAVKGLFIGIMVLLAVWVLTLKGEGRSEDTGEKMKPLHDLRYWAVFILSIQALFYIILG